MNPGTHFLERSCYYLAEDYLPKITICLEELSEDAIWWRPNEQSNSVGNLILHLCGNLRQWIVSGAGGAKDIRERQAEFDEVGPVPKEALQLMLAQTVQDAVEVLSDLPESRLLEPLEIQGFKMTVMGAIYHAVEHFGMHTGQIIYIAKLHTGNDLAFYKITKDGKAIPRWLAE